MITVPSPLTTGVAFIGYSYSYPHKSAYRALNPPVPLAETWRRERRDALFLYIHVPFCEYRCGFCNLFTLAGAEQGLTASYLEQLRREAAAIRGVLPDARFARLAIGGGTPTFLDERELETLLDILCDVMGAEPETTPFSCEASPATLTRSKAALLRQRGVDRISIGVQTFDDAESRRLGRPQRVEEVRRAMDFVREQAFPVLNLDLIYGAAEQSEASWMHSVESALSYLPEEIFLYPLYIREQTGLGKLAAKPGDNRIAAYRAARRALLDAGYEQTSLRMFKLPVSNEAPSPVYCCQSDGMVGLGCGARSYTSRLHYSTEFAVGRSGVRSILLEYLIRKPKDFHWAHHGYRLNREDRCRRFIIQSILQAEGLVLAAYAERFDSDVFDDLPQLSELVDRRLASLESGSLRLTASGIEMSDAIGPWLYSARVHRLMEEFACD